MLEPRRGSRIGRTAKLGPAVPLDSAGFPVACVPSAHFPETVFSLNGADIVGLTGCGACLGVGIVGLIGLLRLIQNDIADFLARTREVLLANTARVEREFDGE
jgi:hypothetical protein